MSDNTPLAYTSKIINEKDQWDSDWYSWLKSFAATVDGMSGSTDALSASVAALSASVDALTTEVANINYGKFVMTCDGVDLSPGPGLSQLSFIVELTGASQFDLGSFGYVVDRAGWYTIYLQVQADEGEATIGVNGTTIASGTIINVEGTNITSVQVLTFLNLGDLVQGFVNIVDPGTTIYGDPTGTFMFGWMVSA